MKFKKWISILVVLVTAETITFAYQKVDPQGKKPQTKQEQPVQVDFISPDELKSKITKNEPLTIIDLRGPNLYAQSEKTIKGSTHTKVRRVVYRFREIPHDRELVTYCECPADEAAIIGARSLLASGYKRVRVLKGGWNAWLRANGPVQARPK